MDIRTLASTIGRTRIAEAVGVGYSTVTEALRAGQFPAAWYPVVRDLAGEHDISVPLDMFTFKRALPDREAAE